MEGINCGLCGTNLQPVNGTVNGLFGKCPVCALVQKNRDCFPNIMGEYEHYLTHNNDPEDLRYIKFLRQAVDPLLPFLRAGMQALDYGCGPGPAMDHILGEYNIACDNYDPFFRKNGINNQAYDAIFCTECFEHFHQPIKDIQNLLDLLKPEGYLSLMTSFYQNDTQFPDWYYSRDPTHVSFFHIDTMKWIQNKLNLECVFTDNKKVMVLKKL